MDDNNSLSPLLRARTIVRDPDSADDPLSCPLPESKAPPPEYSANEIDPPGSRAVKKSGFIRTWLATSSSLRPTGDLTNIKWGIHWHTPVSIVLLLLLGTATAIMHHLFYLSLHDTLVGNEVRQRWTFWIGSGLGFLTKVTLTAALGISRTQWVWLTLRTEWFTLDGIDALFGIISDPLFFLNWKMMKRAKFATTMAIGMWIFPLAAILTPGTISVRTVLRTDIVLCTVPTLLFPIDQNSTAKILAWRDIEDRRGGLIDIYSMMNWNSNPRALFGEPLVPHHQAERVLRLPTYTGTITRLPSLPPFDSPSLTILSADVTTLAEKCGSNCTCTVEFLGPTIICAEFTTWNDTIWRNWSDFMGNSYYRGMNLTDKNTNFLVGMYFVGRPSSVYFVECRPSTAHYTVKHEIQDRHFLEPVIMKVEPVELPDFEPYPIYPNQAYLSSISLLSTVCNILKGQLPTEDVQVAFPATTLLDLLFSDPAGVGPAIETMAQKMLVSLLAFDAPRPDDIRVLEIAATQETNCTTTENSIRYYYSAQTLLLVYGLGVACALAASVAGFIAIGQNGMASNKTVSAIIRTTRNRTLDECIVGGDCLGGEVMSSELEKVMLQFGALKTGTAPFALGVKGEIARIKRE